MPDPVEIKLTLDKTAVERDLARMKEKVRAGTTSTPGQVPGSVRPDSGRVADVEQNVSSDRDARLRAGGGQSSFLQDLATSGPVAAGRRAILGAAESGEFGSFAAGAVKFAGGVAAAGSAVLTAAMIAKAMAESVATVAPIIVGVVNDYLKSEYPWLASTLGNDVEEFTAKISGQITEAIAKLSGGIQAVGETADLEKARARLGQRVDLSQIGSDFSKLQKIRENDAALERKRSNEGLERVTRNVAKQFLKGAH